MAASESWSPQPRIERNMKQMKGAEADGNASHASASLKRVIKSAALGQFVEWYDFVIYAYSAQIIAKLFFPSVDPAAAVLSTFAVYAVGFFMRPLGGFVFGILGDRIGRRALLVAVILIMGASTMGIGLLPTYAQIGVAAPILLVLCRMAQGFSAAGETVASNTFVAEHAPEGKRGRYVAFTFSFSTLPSVVAALLVLALMNGMGPEVYESWGWRVPFLIGGPLALIGLYIRWKVDESPAFEAAKSAGTVSKNPLREAARTQKTPALLTFTLAALSSLAFYTLSGYFVSYLTTGARLPNDQALLSNGIALFVAFFCFWIGGSLSDKYGRKRVLQGTIAATVLLYLPAFWFAGLGTFITALTGQLVIAVIFGLFWGAFGITVVELFPTRTRLSAATISYNLGYTIFGGTAPLLATYLIQQTGVLVAPGIYMMAVAAITLFVIRKMPETANTGLLHAEDIAQDAEQNVRQPSS
ncbi:MFS transporter [Arthrobacter sp. 31Y]|uniref:MFS transporter n=1 Tax=Arthrobacter sp. 31Y TaxID=1115632 RepID=UPI00163A1891|nr:MFS transporter [Arthrobacter sp. 31Y]